VVMIITFVVRFVRYRQEYGKIVGFSMLYYMKYR